MAYDVKKQGDGNDKAKNSTSAEVLAENRNEGLQVAARIAAQKKPHLAPGELSALWAKEKKQGK